MYMFQVIVLENGTRNEYKKYASVKNFEEKHRGMKHKDNGYVIYVFERPEKYRKNSK